jgi:hypothetical protein
MANGDLGDNLAALETSLRFLIWRMAFGRYLFKDMMTVKLKFPSRILLKLCKGTRFDAYRAIVNAKFGLDTC